MTDQAHAEPEQGIVRHEPGEDVLPDLEEPDEAELARSEEETWSISLWKIFEVDVTLGDNVLHVVLKGAGVKMGEVKLTPDDTSAGITAHQGIAKENLTFTANFNECTLHVSGKACYWGMTWHCASFDKQILHW